MGMTTHSPSARLRFLLLALVGLLAAGFLTGCTLNEATGRRQFNLLSTATEIQMGLEAKPQIVAEYGGAVDDPALNAYVSGIGQRLAAETEGAGPGFPWSFTVLDSDVINAFALPGGQVFITRGLMARLDNEAQLAGVLGHEVGHAVAEHGDERISQQLLFTIGMAAVTIASAESDDDVVREGVPLLVGVGGQGFLLSFGRDQEHEADKLGVRYMVRNGYNPMGQLQVMQILAEASGGARSPEFLSTHPHPENRVERLRDMIKGKYAYTQDNAEYQFYAERFQANVPAYMFQIDDEE